MLGAIFLLGALSFGINKATLRRGVLTGTVIQAVAVSMPIGLAMFALVAAASGQLGDIDQFSPVALAMLAAAGVVHFVFGRYCAYRSIQAMGANLSAPVAQWSLLVTLVLAVVFLQESLNLLKLLGIGLLVAGPAMAVGTRKAPGRSAPAEAAPPEPAPRAAGPAKFQPRLAEGYLFGILSCFAYGSSPILLRAGLKDNGLALAGGVVSYGAATLVVALVLLLPMPRRDALAIGRGNGVWFIWTGITVCMAQIFIYLATAIAPVTVVQPLLRLQNVFGTLFAWIFNREHELFDSGVLGAIALSIVGALLLTVHADIVMQWMNAPPWLAGVLAWSWPGPGG